MAAPALMVQGTGSNVGKSLIVAGLCRAYANAGLSVRPFKPQNMSNNAGVATDGGEIGRAQMLQARGARAAPSVHMNPVLLKPESETGAQVVVQGRRLATMKAREYGARKASLLPAVLESFGIVSRDADLVLIEGAGSPAEVNLREGDIANMGFAEAADVPVLLVGDIDRGGVIASLVGTHTVLPENERARVKAFVVNRFRGDVALFENGAALIEARTGWPCAGIVPHFPDAARLPAEDVLGLAGGVHRGPLHVVVPRLGRIANFDDLDPLAQEPQVRLTIVEPGEALPGDAALVLIPGSKSTIADLDALRVQGWDIDLKAHVRRCGAVLGLCGGYQMLGRAVHDPGGIEGPPRSVEGLGLLDVETVLAPEKVTRDVRGEAMGAELTGYEIHLGETKGPDTRRPFAQLQGEADGATSSDGRVAGTYLHGLFASDAFRRAYLRHLGAEGAGASYGETVENVLDGLAAHLAAHLDLDHLLRLARGRA